MSFVSFFATPMSQTDDHAYHWGTSPIHSKSPHLLQVVTHTPILHPLMPLRPTRYLRSSVPRARLVSARSLCCLVASDPPSLSPLELERCISAYPSVPLSVHPSPHARYYIVSWHITTNTCGHCHEYQVFFAMSCLFSQPKTPQQMSTMSTNPIAFQQHTGVSFNDIYNTPNVSLMSSSSGDPLFSSGSSISGPSTPLDNSLCSPVHISYTGDSTFGTSGGPPVLDSSAYNQLMCHCRHLESELMKERQEHATLKYALVPCVCCRIH